MKPGYLALVLQAHLPFVREPEHERFLEESWLFEAVAECYLPLIHIWEGWQRDGVPARLTLSLSPTLCEMLRDPLLQARCARYLESRLELADKEVHRTRRQPALHALACFYRARFAAWHELYHRCGGDLVGVFRRFQEQGRLELAPTAATHALLPLLAAHPPSLRAQIRVALDCYRHYFGTEPRGFWLPECAYGAEVEAPLREANLRWFILDTHGVLQAQPPPLFGVYAPVFTPNGIAAFGRDPASARQVWSRAEGYPGDARYRDFYRDAGYDLDFDYVRPYLPSPDHRGFTGLKYHRITGATPDKALYDRAAALRAAAEHAADFLRRRSAELQRLSGLLDRPPIVVCPYDAELFGHWWYEGPEFLDSLVRLACRTPDAPEWITPLDYLKRHPTLQVASPAASSWGEAGYFGPWLSQANHWIQPRLLAAQRRMTELAARFERPSALQARALAQAARELLLAQASDWPFLIHAGTSSQYARCRVEQHLTRFLALHEQLTTREIDPAWLERVERQDNIFPQVQWRHWQ